MGEVSAATEYTISFSSAVTTEHPANDVVPLTVFVPRGEGPFPVVLILHYWGALDQRVERAMAHELAKRRVASVLMPLPYHLARTPEGFRSGELAIRPDPKKLIATMTQSVLDARRAIDFIVSRPEFAGNDVGLAGTSLGAIIASLLYAVEPRISKAAFVLGGADLAYTLWNSSRVVAERDELRRQGYTEAKLRAELAPIEPLTYLPSRQNGSTFVVGARYDTVIPGASTERLMSALPNPKVLWLDTGHYGGFFVQRRLLGETAEFFAKEFAGEEYFPPARIQAPTIRMGAQFNADTGLDIGAGLDVWKADPKGNVFSTIFITPRGTNLYIGRKVDRAISIGIAIAPSRTSFGVMWSTVL